MNDTQVIREFLTTLVAKDVQFSDTDSLLSTQLIDSLNVAELITFIENTYNIAFENDDVTPDNLDSIAAIVGFLERKGVTYVTEPNIG